MSGPLLDRIDIHIEVPAVPLRDLAGEPPREDSFTIIKRVNQAREIQQKRYASDGIYCNAQLRPRQLKKFCSLGEESRRLIELSMGRLGLSGRAYNRILKVARTIADLEGAEQIHPIHISEAIQYRSLDRRNLI